jgi:hypothetical protein
MSASTGEVNPLLSGNDAPEYSYYTTTGSTKAKHLEDGGGATEEREEEEHAANGTQATVLLLIASMIGSGILFQPYCFMKGKNASLEQR